MVILCWLPTAEKPESETAEKLFSPFSDCDEGIDLIHGVYCSDTTEAHLRFIVYTELKTAFKVCESTKKVCCFHQTVNSYKSQHFASDSTDKFKKRCTFSGYNYTHVYYSLSNWFEERCDFSLDSGNAWVDEVLPLVALYYYYYNYSTSLCGTIHLTVLALYANGRSRQRDLGRESSACSIQMIVFLFLSTVCWSPCSKLVNIALHPFFVNKANENV